MDEKPNPNGIKMTGFISFETKKKYFILILKNTQMTHRKSILDPFLIPSQNIRVHWLGGVVDVYTIISLLMNWRIGTVHKGRLQSRGGREKSKFHQKLRMHSNENLQTRRRVFQNKYMYIFADVLFRWSLKDEVMSGAIFSKPNQACLSPPTAAVYIGLD